MSETSFASLTRMWDQLETVWNILNKQESLLPENQQMVRVN